MTDLTAIQTIHKKGELRKAKQLYLKFLEKNPNNAEALHALGLLYVQQEKFDQAVDYFQQAADLAPDSAALLTHLGNAQQALGLFAQSSDTLKKALDIDPDNPQILNNLGVIYYRLGNLDLAIRYYEHAVAKGSDYADAHFNLGVARAKKGQLDSAAQHYDLTLTYAEHHPGAHYQLGKLLMNRKRFKEAEVHFSKLKSLSKTHAETLVNLASCLLNQGLLSKAKDEYMALLELPISKEDLIRVLYNVAFIYMQQGKSDDAIKYYQHVIKEAPDHFDSHNNLGVSFILKKNVAFALKHFQEALRLQPDNKAIQHTVNSLSQEKQLESTPSDYVKNLFDHYAEHYDVHLLSALDYQVPVNLNEAFGSTALATRSDLRMLDLGCGTGLCAGYFKKHYKFSVGVDVSQNMLAVAENKGLYDDLICSDALDYLQGTSTRFDLIISGDVVVYFGKLDELFMQCHRVLSENGIFVFNTEVSVDRDYHLNQSGRFSHSQSYVSDVAQAAGFDVLSCEEKQTRLQNDKPVLGYVFSLRRPA
jgi:predicted TPR repeat methyltransferase